MVLKGVTKFRMASSKVSVVRHDDNIFLRCRKIMFRLISGFKKWELLPITTSNPIS